MSNETSRVSDEELRNLIAALKQMKAVEDGLGAFRLSIYEELQEARQQLAAEKERADRYANELSRANNEFGSQITDWPNLWERIAEVKSYSKQFLRERDELKQQLAELLHVSCREPKTALEINLTERIKVIRAQELAPLRESHDALMKAIYEIDRTEFCHGDVEPEESLNRIRHIVDKALEQANKETLN